MSPLRVGLVALIVLAPEIVRAQPEATEVAAAPLMTVDEPEFVRFAEVWRQVAEIRQRYAQRLQAGDEREALWAQANQEMRVVVEGSTLSPQRYNQLAATVAADPALKSRLAAHLGRPTVPPQ